MGASRGNRDFLGLVSFGTFLVAVGSLFAFIPNLVDRLREFITDFELLEISQGIYLPVVRARIPKCIASCFGLELRWRSPTQ